MATLTLGTNATNSIPYSITHSQAIADADMATISQRILNDANRTAGGVGGSYTKGGNLWFPQRGWLRVIPGDVVDVIGLEGSLTYEQQANLRAEVGLTRSRGEQFWQWLAMIAGGDFGLSSRFAIPVIPWCRPSSSGSALR